MPFPQLLPGSTLFSVENFAARKELSSAVLLRARVNSNLRERVASLQVARLSQLPMRRGVRRSGLP